jgi:hypothetical protein
MSGALASICQRGCRFRGEIRELNLFPPHSMTWLGIDLLRVTTTIVLP